MNTFSKSIEFNIQSFALFLGRSFIFSCIFWLSWIFVFRDVIASYSHDSVITSSQTADSDQYQKQLKESARQLEIGAGQQIQLNNILTLQEENARRYSALLDIWEREANRNAPTAERK